MCILHCTLFNRLAPRCHLSFDGQGYKKMQNAHYLIQCTVLQFLRPCSTMAFLHSGSTMALFLLLFQTQLIIMHNCTCLLYAPLHLGRTSHHAPAAVKSETMIRGFHLFKNVAAPLCTNRPQHCFEQLRLDALDLLKHTQPDANISVLQGHILQSYTPEFYNTLSELL